MSKADSGSAARAVSFEEAMERLQVLVERMESGELPLAELISSYEEGIRLVEECGKQLKAANVQVERLTLKTEKVLSGLVDREGEDDEDLSE